MSFIKDDNIYNVAVIDSGVVGTAIAQELSKYNLQSVLLETKSDIASSTSKTKKVKRYYIVKLIKCVVQIIPIYWIGIGKIK